MSEEPTAEKDAAYEQGYRDALTAVARLMFSPQAPEILRPLLPDARCYDPRCTIVEHDHSLGEAGLLNNYDPTSGLIARGVVADPAEHDPEACGDACCVLPPEEGSSRG